MWTKIGVGGDFGEQGNHPLPVPADECDEPGRQFGFRSAQAEAAAIKTEDDPPIVAFMEDQLRGHASASTSASVSSPRVALAPSGWPSVASTSCGPQNSEAWSART